MQEIKHPEKKKTSNITKEEEHTAAIGPQKSSAVRHRLRPDARTDQTRPTSTHPWMP